MTTSAISKNFALNGAHTAGIFADMTVDGPEIGTLVCVVDRAKNLPNRKTIGKQDPYCAARLGKEAKKTSTDIRGGQTPRWDQELRFTVHDTADYYQLKVSVFTDDKKTDLIGETWVDLKSIITSGGGQCDFWKTLTCRGKYAGDIRLEITYYDTRPKPDKSPAKPKPPSPDHLEMSPVKRKDVIKRRPVSSMDPAVVEAPSPISAAIPTNDISRLQGRPPLPSDYSSLSSRGGRQSLGTVGGPRELRQTRRDAYENPRHSEERDLNIHRTLASAPQLDYLDSRGEHAAYASDREEPRQHYGGGHPPPPPPAHRARGDHDVPRRLSLEGAPQQAMHPAASRHELLKNEPQRKPSPSYPGRPKFKGTMPSAHPSTPLQKAITYNPHMGGDVYGAYDPARSMQPTVEDYPESEAGSYGPNYRHSNGPRALPDEMAYARGGGYDRYDRVPVGLPAQVPMSRSPGASGGYLSQSPGRVSGDFREPQHRYTHSVPQASHRDYDDETVVQMPYQGHAGHGRRHSPPYDRRAANTFHPNSSSHSLQDLPSSLVPGADPNLAQEVAHRMYDDRRHGERYYGGQSTAVSTMRDGQRSDPPTYDMHVDDLRGSPSQAGAAPRYDRRSDPDYYNDATYQAPRRRDVSPNPARSPNHAIRRKSVSPGPRISESRRLSDIPYGPDSYDTYNPGASRDGTPGLDAEPPSKIVMHDGTEVDPSDHLPMESWAPEPEQRPTQAPLPVENRSRPALTGAQPMPPSGRRQLRVRAQSNTTPSHSSEDLRLIPGGAAAGVGGGGGGAAPPPSARGRLQKKANRASVPSHPLSGLDAYASLSSDDLHDRQGQYSHSRSPRASAWDYSSDGYTPKDHQQGGAHGPPIPAKVPLPITGGGVGGAEVALMEEMQKIDIGTGRSRRRGGY